MNNLTIKHKGETIGELAVTNQGIVLVYCHEDFRRGLRDRLRNGINLGEAYSDLNFKPHQVSEEETLRKIGELYKFMYHCQAEYS